MPFGGVHAGCVLHSEASLDGIEFGGAITLLADFFCELDRIIHMIVQNSNNYEIEFRIMAEPLSAFIDIEFGLQAFVLPEHHFDSDSIDERALNYLRSTRIINTEEYMGHTSFKEASKAFDSRELCIVLCGVCEELECSCIVHHIAPSPCPVSLSGWSDRRVSPTIS